MFEQIPSYVLYINQTLQNSGFEVFLVGGCVRNLFLGKPVADWDFTTNATPKEMLKLFPNGFYDNAFGTVGVPIEVENKTSSPPRVDELASLSLSGQRESRQVIQITTYRTEHGYSDRRRPDDVAWGQSIEEDVARRDFTINAVALEITNKSFDNAQDENSQQSTRIIDPYDGQKDLLGKTIRAVGDPKQRFKEDALRLMRAIRLATQLGFTIEQKTLDAIIDDASLINEIAAERIKDELLKLLASEYPYEGIILLRNTNLLQYILPELLEGIGVSQERPGRHHKTDVFTHNLQALKFCPSKDPVVRFATLIHDIGKPRVAATDTEGFVIFHNHEIEGSKMAYQIAERLRFSKKERQKIVTLVRWHMFTVDEKATDSAIRRFIRHVGVENVEDMIDLRIGDRLGSGTQTAESWRLKLFKKRIEEQLAPAPFSINDLAINGNDVMKELGIKPGPKIGEILQKLFEEVDEDLSKNTKEYLVKLLHELK